MDRRRPAAKLLSKGEARRIAANIAKLPAARLRTGLQTSLDGSGLSSLKEIIRKKQKGEKIERPKAPAHGKVINLMDALRQSVEASGGRKKAAAHHRREPKRASRSHSRHKKAS